MTRVYLACYKGGRDWTGWQNAWPYLKARTADYLIRLFTRGPYSHCEIAVSDGGRQYRCYSSSVRDGGVRLKTMPLPSAKWDLIPLPPETAAHAAYLYEQTRGAGYDWRGALGTVLRLRQSGTRWFCSEWCARALRLPGAWTYSPNALAARMRQPDF
ncbi:hypothetical protein [Neisseria animalis]|uniref:Enoyl-CoA hydratase n=1 Tax=Neisseria animalis TaxID=492 RepID=A0A5P3MRY5_NEIAN|nr:hypothetical protein [Neisseria animalis]QEY23561.1 hypothetical protein D0T90_02805 [Neisseria animalis]ROW32161.1 hypothetical protein CGZ60_06185 [Neisseria animalis]VEE09221.1 Uncharacterised protein [Neisseria animalis]